MLRPRLRPQFFVLELKALEDLISVYSPQCSMTDTFTSHYMSTTNIHPVSE